MSEIKSPFWRTAAEYGIITVSIWIMVVGIYFFKFPNHFAFGGVTGFSTVVSEISRWSASDFTFIVNTSLLVLGFIFLGKGFGIKTVYASMVMSISLSLLERVCPLSRPLTTEPLLELLFAIFLPGIGSAVLFNIGASSGGTDIIAMILKKYTSISDIGKALFVSDSVIALAACFFFGIETGMFSLLGLFLKAFVVDSVIESINLCKFFSIVTSKPDEICDFIIKDLHHSSTVVDGQGAFSHQDRKVVLTAVRRGEAVRLRQKCKEIDPHSFMFITNTSEIIGKGFRSD